MAGPVITATIAEYNEAFGLKGSRAGRQIVSDPTPCERSSGFMTPNEELAGWRLLHPGVR